jgi:hypothetical protein
LYIDDPAYNPGWYTDWHTGLALLQVNWETLKVSLAFSPLLRST